MPKLRSTVKSQFVFLRMHYKVHCNYDMSFQENICSCRAGALLPPAYTLKIYNGGRLPRELSERSWPKVQIALYPFPCFIHFSSSSKPLNLTIILLPTLLEHQLCPLSSPALYFQIKKKKKSLPTMLETHENQITTNLLEFLQELRSHKREKTGIEEGFAAQMAGQQSVLTGRSVSLHSSVEFPYGLSKEKVGFLEKIYNSKLSVQGVKQIRNIEGKQNFSQR